MSSPLMKKIIHVISACRVTADKPGLHESISAPTLLPKTTLPKHEHRQSSNIRSERDLAFSARDKLLPKAWRSAQHDRKIPGRKRKTPSHPIRNRSAHGRRENESTSKRDLTPTGYPEIFLFREGNAEKHCALGIDNLASIPMS